MGQLKCLEKQTSSCGHPGWPGSREGASRRGAVVPGYRAESCLGKVVPRMPPMNLLSTCWITHLTMWLSDLWGLSYQGFCPSSIPTSLPSNTSEFILLPERILLHITFFSCLHSPLCLEYPESDLHPSKELLLERLSSNATSSRIPWIAVGYLLDCSPFGYLATRIICSLENLSLISIK